jgi:hypothetical protein
MCNRLSSALILVPFAALLFVVAGCGAYNPNGSGNGGGGGTNPGQAQGFYSCTLEDGTTMEALILPDDTFFGMFGPLNLSSFSATGMATGQGTSGDLTYSGTFTHFANTGTSSTDVLAATDLPQSSLGGSITLNGVKEGFGGAAPPASSYNYNSPASQSAITGTWAGSLLDGTSVSLIIGATGSVTSPSGSVCSIASGSTIIADTKNDFYTVNLTFGSSGCPSSLAGATAKGKGVFYVLQDRATHELLLAATVSTTVGTAFFAAK